MRVLVLALLSGLLLIACREGSTQGGGAAGITVELIPPSTEGADGCNGPNHVFSGPFPIVPLAVWSSPLIASTSRMTSAQGVEELYVTLVDGGLAELDFTGGGAPLETELLPAHFIRDQILAPSGIVGDAVVSGVSVTTTDNVILMEHTGNMVVVARRDPPAFAAPFGMPDASGGFIDGALFSAKFRFDEPGDLCPAADGRIFFPDTGNHVLRVIESTPGGVFVTTVAGTGQTDSADGDIISTSFDTPSGMKVDCANQLIVTERGTFGGGNRLRAVAIGIDPFFGGVAVDSRTLAGNGDPFTVEGTGESASLAGPSPAVTTSAGEVYWVDTLTGVLRRYRFSTGIADCPLDVDCATAITSTVLTPGGDFALTISAAGDLYVLDNTAQTLYRVP